MALSLPRSRSVEAISYGYIGCCHSSDSSDSPSRLFTLRRGAIPYHLVSEPPFTRIRSQVLVDEYTHADTRPQWAACRLFPERAGQSAGVRRLFQQRGN